jgi:hypothetical protein
MTPKDDFLKTPEAKTHADLVGTPAFKSAMRFALLEFVASQPRGPAIAEAWDAHSQLQGAMRFASILEKLSTVEESPQPERLKTIDHSAYERRNRNA